MEGSAHFSYFYGIPPPEKRNCKSGAEDGGEQMEGGGDLTVGPMGREKKDL